MKKKLIRITESDLHRIIKESVRRILSEGGTNDIKHGRGYDFYKEPSHEDYIYDNYGEDVYRKYMKWRKDVNFLPILFGYGYGTYDDGDIVTDDRAMHALEEELTKLDSCPLFNPEQVEAFKEFINNDLEDMDKEWQANDY